MISFELLRKIYIKLLYSSFVSLYIFVIILFNIFFFLETTKRVPNPETDPADGPPAQFIEQWTADNPVYMRFGSDGVSVQKDFKKTYNIALDEDDEKNGQT